MNVRLILCSIAMLAVPLAAGVPARAEPRTVIRNVEIVDVVAGEVGPVSDVVIEDGKIVAISPAGDAAVGENDSVVDGAGRCLMPGLFDCHVHYVSPDTYGPLMIAHGVTFVRDMGGDTAQVLMVRDQLNRGEMLGPEMIVTGAIIDGDPPVWPFSEACDTADEGRAAVKKLADAGVDQIKLYSKLNREAYLAAAEAAKERGLKPVGHVPLSMSLDEVIAAGQASVEHLDGFDELIMRCAGEEVGDGRDYRDNFKRWDAYPRADQEKLREAYARMKAAGTVICPTMVVMRGIGSIGEIKADDPRMAFVPGFLKGMWGRESYQYMAPGARRVVPQMQAVVAELHQAGVKLVCGTDLANPYVFAGASVHEELALFQAAGVPTADVLRTATVNAAELCGVADRLGTVAVGKAASLVLVRANPFEDVRNARLIDGVWVRGKYFDRAALDQLIEGAKSAVGAEISPGGKSTGETVDMSLPGDVVRRGTYRMKFMQYDAGSEEFVITRDADGVHIKAYTRPQGGPQGPSVGTFHLDAELKLREAVWEPLGGAKSKTTYALDGKVMVARHEPADGDAQEQRTELPEAWMFGSPFTAYEYANMATARMEVGASHELKNVGFGFPDWRVGITDYSIKRLEDQPLALPDGTTVTARYYTSELKLPMGVFSGETWTDEAGIILKSVLKMPFGTITTTLDAAE